MKSILAFGDSLTWGFVAGKDARHAFEDRWPNALAAGLNGKAHVLAEGMNARTTVYDDPTDSTNLSGAVSLPIMLKTHQPLDLVIIMLGTNDIKFAGLCRAFDAAMGMERLIKLVKTHDYMINFTVPQILIMSPPCLVKTDDEWFNELWGHAIGNRKYSPSIILALPKSKACISLMRGAWLLLIKPTAAISMRRIRGDRRSAGADGKKDIGRIANCRIPQLFLQIRVTTSHSLLKRSEINMADNNFDVIIIGSGPGGYVTAIRAAELGFKTAIVEREHLGGICLNWGCIPTKALLRSAEIYHYIKHAKDYGLSADNIKFDAKAVVQRSRGLSGRLNGGVGGLLKKNKVQVIWGEAKITKPGEVAVAKSSKAPMLPQNPEPKGTLGAGTYTAKHIIIATGARPRTLPGLEGDGKLVWTYFEAMVPPEMPKSLLVVGSGAIGIRLLRVLQCDGRGCDRG